MTKLVLITFVFSCLFSIPIAAAIWFLGRKRADWLPWDFPIVFVPFLTWIIMILVDGSGKSFSNAFVEPVLCGIVGGFLPLIRVVVGGSSFKKKNIALVVSAIVGIAWAIAVYSFVPSLPE